MLHEITDPEEDWINFDRLQEESKQEDIIQPNQRLEVVKITRCKMR